MAKMFYKKGEQMEKVPYEESVWYHDRYNPVGKSHADWLDLEQRFK